MTLVALLWPALCAVVVLGVVGGALAWSVGLRGLWAVGAATPFALTVIGGSAVVASWVGVPWSILPVLVVGAVIMAGILAVRRRTSHPGLRPRRRVDVWLLAALAVSVVVLAARFAQIVGGPEHISQTFDNIFHLNGVRYILDEGSASSLRLGYMTSPDGSLPFYPAGWHALVALVVQFSGAEIPVAVNATVLVVTALVWPVGAVLLVRTLFGRHPAVTVAAAAVATAIPAFPILLMDYGVLYPFQLGMAVVPIAIAAVLRLLDIVPRRDPRGIGWWVFILIGLIPGMTIAHPGAFVAWLALTAPFVVIFIVIRFRAARGARARIAIALWSTLYVVVGALLVRILRPPAEARGWATQMSMLDALWQGVSVSMWYQVPAIAVAIAGLAGLVWALIDRTRAAIAALAMYAVGLILFVTVAALPFAQVRDILTGSWYNNLPRLAAILAVAMVPLAAYGIARSWLAVAYARPIRRRLLRAPRPARALVALAAAIGLIAVMQGPAMNRAVEWASPLYRLDDTSPLLTREEYALLERVPDHVPAGVAIAGSPWTGAALAYAIADRPVLMPHTLMQISEAVHTINDGLDSSRGGDAVCAAVDALGVGFVLDFGMQEVHPGVHPMPGLDGLADSPAVRLVDQEADVRLYEIVACG